MSELVTDVTDVTGGPGSSAEVLRRYRGAVMGTYGTPQRVLVRGEGCYVWDADGRRYLDLLAGIAVNALGHAHPFLVSAITAQLATLGHVSNFFATPLQVALAERLLELLDAPEGSAVFFCNSGAEAIEGSLKISRRTGRTGLVAAEGGFHGRTLGALSLTHKPAYREPFQPLVGDVVHVPFGDAEALRAAITSGTAAVVLEPVQGEGGVRPAPPGYLATARAATAEAGALLVLDEVQCGIGRTGAWFAHQLPDLGDGAGGGVRPDVVTLAKGLAGGIPIGAVVAYGHETSSMLAPGQHGTTFGGNPVACAAALSVIETIESEALLEHVTVLGQKLRDGLAADPRVTEVRGQGLLIGLDLSADASADVTAAALGRGFILNNPTPRRIRLAPPLVLTDDDATAFLAAWPTILDDAMGARA
jgi:acetylornithine/N-succinyldiaminopimelate aminotransferase